MARPLCKLRLMAKAKLIFADESNFKNIRITGRKLFQRLSDFIAKKFPNCDEYRVLYMYLCVDKDGDIEIIDHDDISGCHNIIATVCYFGCGVPKKRFEKHTSIVRSYFRKGSAGLFFFV